MRSKFLKYIRLAADKPSLWRAIRVALIVGVILNMINNPKLFSAYSSADFHLSRILLTFLVPFCVSLYSSVLANAEK
ncbi:MAG: nitrate/nitrite transporter NrtS [Lentimicrobium sp.]|nr:nitrate/nitrite transporter NrtS [Lentimicrobium sp.]